MAEVLSRPLRALIASYGEPEEQCMWAHTDYFEVCGAPELDNKMCDKAAEKGLLEVVKWAMKRGLLPSANVSYDVARAGHWPVLQYLAECKHVKYNYQLSRCAAQGGSIAIIQHLMERKAPLCETNYVSNLLHNTHVGGVAAYFGHFALVLWLHERKMCPLDIVVQSAGAGNEPEILTWALHEGGTLVVDRDYDARDWSERTKQILSAFKHTSH